MSGSWSAALGRTALTGYLLQTIICTTIFYAHGLGLFGQLERRERISVAFAVWLFRLIASPIWLRFPQFGPAEWLWRSLTCQRFQPTRCRTLDPSSEADFQKELKRRADQQRRDAASRGPSRAFDLTRRTISFLAEMGRCTCFGQYLNGLY